MGNNNRKKKKSSGKALMIILPILFLLVIVMVVLFIMLRLKNFVNTVDASKAEGLDESDPNYENLDNIVPLTDENGYLVEQDINNILVFGNDPFATDRDSSDGLAALLADSTGANVINCALAGTHVTAQNRDYSADAPMDLFTPYYLSCLIDFGDSLSEKYTAAESDYADLIPENAQEVVDTLMKLDGQTVDVVVFLYDNTDYELGSDMVDNNNLYRPDTFCGNLMAAYSILKTSCPNARLIFASPYFTYQVDEDGNYYDPELTKDGDDAGTLKPSDYVLYENNSVTGNMGATFIDNYFSSINEDNASEYLLDDRNLNAAGRKLIVDRLVYAINYFIK